MKRFSILALFIASIMISSFLFVPVGESQGSEREFRQVHINMKADDKLSPEFFHDNETVATKKHVTADYDQGPLTRANRRQVDAGTWTSEGMDGSMTIDSGQFTFNVWFQVTGDYQADADWEFYLFHNDEQIASATVTNSDESTDEPVDVRASGNIASPVDVRVGDTLKINIKYTAWEDCDLYFDNIKYDSGGAGSMDSIHILEAKGSAEAKFFDAFGINWMNQGKYFCNVNSGETTAYGDVDTEVKEGGTAEGANGTTYQTTKMIFKNLDIPDGQAIILMITYGPSESGSEGWTVSYNVGSGGVGGNGDDDDSGLDTTMIGGVSAVVVVLGGVLAYLFVFKKGADEEEDDEEYDEEDDEESDEEYDEEEE